MSAPPLPSSIANIVLFNEDVQNSLQRHCDCCIENGSWANALDDNNNFGFDLTGDNVVYQFASQGCGSVFGLQVGQAALDSLLSDTLNNQYRVVHISSEGSTAVVASNLQEFWSLALTLNTYLNDVITRASTCSFSPDASDQGLNDALREQTKTALQRWRTQDQEDTTQDDAQELLTNIRSASEHLGVQLLSDEEAVDRIFELQGSGFEPRSLE